MKICCRYGFIDQMGVPVFHLDAADHFLSCLAGEAGPEKKRKIIGIFDAEAAKLKNAHWLAQGTIYPDVIESAASKTGGAHVIKSHQTSAAGQGLNTSEMRA